MSLPTIVVVPAVCQTPAHYQPLASALQIANFTVAVIRLSSVGASPALKNFDERSRRRSSNVATSLVKDGAEVVVLLHSYAGLPGSVAMRGLGGGKEGGVRRLVYVASWALKEGEALPGRAAKE